MRFARAALAALLMLCAIPADAAVYYTRYTLKANPDGHFTPAFPCVLTDRSDCAPPTVATLEWIGTVAGISVTNGATGSRSVRLLYLNGSAAAAATLVLSCSPTIGGTFSAGADGESWSTSTSYSGVCHWTASTAGTSARSNDFNIVSTAAPSADTTAPSIPIRLACTHTSGSGQAACTWNASSDLYESDGDTGTGVTSYDLCMDGANCLNVPVTAGASRQVALTNLGTLSPTPTCTQSGVNWTDVAAGTVDGTSSLSPFCGASVTSTQTSVTTMSVKVNSLTNPTNNGKCGLRAMDHLAADSKEALCHVQWNTGNVYKGQFRTRPTDGGTVSGQGQVTLTGLPIWLQLTEPTPTTLSCEYSTDGNVFSPINASYALTLADTASLGHYDTATTGAGGATMGCDLQEFSLTNSLPVSATYNTDTANGAHTFTIRANDSAGNHSSYGAGVSVTLTAPADTTPPARTVQPSGAASGSSTSIVWSLGTCTDAGGVRGYVPYTKTSASGTRTAQAEQATNTWTQTGLTANTTYYLDVKCVDTAGNAESAFSTETSATTAASVTDPVAAPVISSVTALSTSSLRATWAAATNAHHYRVRYKLASASTFTTISTQFTSLTTDITGLVASSVYDVQVASANSAESVLLWSSSTQGTTSSLGAAVKWHPGYYGLTGATTKSATTLGYTNSMVTNLAASPNIIGILHFVEWDVLETSRGVYDFSTIDNLLSLCQSNGKRLMILILDRSFSGTSNNVVPTYLSTESGGGGGWSVKPSNSGIVARLWLAPIMDRRIALDVAMAAHVVPGSGGLTLDTHPYFEAIYTEESALGSFVAGDPCCDGYSRASWAAQQKRWMAAVPLAWPHTNTVMQLNYLSGEIDSLVAYAASHRVMNGGPDTIPSGGTTAQNVFNGLCETTGCTPRNYHGVTGAGWQVQSATLNGHFGGTHWTMDQIRAEAEQNGNTHFPIIMRVDTGMDPSWTAPAGGFKAYIDAGHPLSNWPAACPSTYPSCNTN